MYLIIWSLLVTIAVSDARIYRIRNSHLILLFICIFTEKVTSLGFSIQILLDLAGGLVFFFGSLGLFALRAMAPGDVKLLGVVGFWLGWGNLWDATMWLSISTVVIGLFYSLERAASRGDSWNTFWLRFVPQRFEENAESAKSQLIVMPFAPVIVIGLALNSYF